MSKLCERVILRIKNEEIKPVPRCYFLFVRIILVAVMAGLFLMASMLTGQIMEILSKIQLDFLWDLPNRFSLILTALPYGLISGIILIIGVFMAEFFRTRRGYKYKAFPAAFLIIVLMVILGAVFYAGGVCAKADKYLRVNSSFYNSLVVSPDQVWLQPEKGLLWGTVTFDDEKGKKMEVRDAKNNDWLVDYKKVSSEIGQGKKQGKMVRMAGTKGRGKTFQAEKISLGSFERR